MKTSIKLITISILILIFASAGFSQQRRQAPPVEFVKISENLYQVTGGSGANGGVYIGDDAVLVIDAKMNEESVKAVFDGIKKLTDKPVKYLVNTHSDGDHINGNKFFPKDITIIAHENCRKEFFHPRSNGDPSAWNDPELAPYIPHQTFNDKMTLYLGSKKVELYYFVIGHTTGDAVLYFPE